MKFKDAVKSLREVLLRGTAADRFSQRLQRLKHVRKALLQHCQEQFQTPLKVDIQSALRAAHFLRDLPGCDPRQTARVHQLLRCLENLRSTVDFSETSRAACHG